METVQHQVENSNTSFSTVLPHTRANAAPWTWDRTSCYNPRGAWGRGGPRFTDFHPKWRKSQQHRHSPWTPSDGAPTVSLSCPNNGLNLCCTDVLTFAYPLNPDMCDDESFFSKSHVNTFRCSRLVSRQLLFQKLTLCHLASCCLSVALRGADTDMFSTWHKHTGILIRSKSAEHGLLPVRTGGHAKITH